MSGPTEHKAAHLQQPDVSYQVPKADRVLVRGNFDLQALEEFLQFLYPVQREGILRSFQTPPRVRPSARAQTPGVATDRSAVHSQPLPDRESLIRVSDPFLQTLLERVWAPTYRGKSLERLDRMDPQLPGLEAAKRAARAKQSNQ